MNDHDYSEEENIAIPEASFADLLGKQSVRATFRLSERAIEAISLVAGHLGIKKKSLFDHLIEDSKALHTIARTLSSGKRQEFPRIQKTFVLSRRTLTALEQISRTFDTPRDALVEYSIQRLDAVIRIEREKHEQRKHLVGELEQHLALSQSLLDRARERLGDDDAVCLILEKHLAAGMQAHRDMETLLEKGRMLEDF
ncbi:hypothetical protein JCM14469_07160 [Desulfatiferula olefinivorans]